MKVYVAPPRGEKETETYLNWLRQNGYEPIILDLRFKKISSPLVLCGGADIGKNPERDQRELEWIHSAIENKQPIIGICRGMQMLNYYFGGKVEDLQGAISEYHSADNFLEDTDHSEKKSQFHYVKNLHEEMFEVNSRHHQWCSKVAPNFKVTHISIAVDYIPEAIEDKENKIIAVQWHPEREEGPIAVDLFKYMKLS